MGLLLLRKKKKWWSVPTGKKPCWDILYVQDAKAGHLVEENGFDSNGPSQGFVPGRLQGRSEVCLHDRLFQLATTSIPAQEIKEVEDLGMKMFIDLFIFFFALLLLNGNKLN